MDRTTLSRRGVDRTAIVSGDITAFCTFLEIGTISSKTNFREDLKPRGIPETMTLQFRRDDNKFSQLQRVTNDYDL